MARTAPRTLDPTAICRTSDPLAVRELLTKIGDKWTIFVVLSLDLLGGRARFRNWSARCPAFRSGCWP
jgi:DNA-binding HxlR family transcriptional regulator